MSNPSDVASAGEYTVRLVAHYDEFLKLETAWNHLCNTFRQNSVFLRHEWYDAAWQWQRRQAQLFVPVVYCQEQVVGILPVVRRYRRRRGFRVRMLEFLSVPDTQQADVLVDGDHKMAVLETLTAYLANNMREWDLIELKWLSEQSLVLTEWKLVLDKHGIGAGADVYARNPVVQLSGTWDHYYGQKSRRFKKANNHNANRLRRAASVVNVRRIFGATVSGSDVSNALDNTIRISARSWKQSTSRSLDNPGPMAFIRQLTRHAVDNGWLSLWLLELDGEPTAMEYQLNYNGRVSALRSDFDARWDDISPGSYLNRVLLEELFSGSNQCYSMGPGENEYKLRWADDFEDVFQLHIYGNSWRARMLYWVETVLLPVARRFRERGLLGRSWGRRGKRRF